MKSQIQLFLDKSIEIIPVNLWGKLDKNGNYGKTYSFPTGWGANRNKDWKSKNTFWKFNNVAIRTGKENNITVIDLDFTDKERIKNVLKDLHINRIQDVPYVKTRQGFHLYFKYNEKIFNGSIGKNYNKIKYGDGIDIRGEGGCIFAPPSEYYCEDKTFKYEVDDFEKWVNEIKNDLIEIHDDFIPLNIEENMPKESVPPNKKNNKIITINKNPTKKEESKQTNFNIIDVNQVNEITEEHQKLIDLVEGDSEETVYKMACIVKRLNYSFDILEKWASRSNFYNKATFKTWVMPKWKSAEKYNFNEGTLHFLARKANEKVYQDIKTLKYKYIVEEFMKRKTDTDLAILFSKIFENIVCIDTKKQIFMIPDDFNKWEQHDKPTISKLLSFGVYEILNDHLFLKIREKNVIDEEFNDLEKKMKREDLTDEERISVKNEKEIVEKKREQLLVYNKALNKYIKACRTKNTKSSFISEIGDLTYNTKIIQKLDETNLYLMNFENGCYDLQIGEFRYPEIDEYVQKTTGYKFNPTVDEDIQKEIFDIADKIYKSEDGSTEVRDYQFKTVASCLCGYNKYENFYVWTGGGGNGKGLLDTLYSYTFGEYYGIVDSSYFIKSNKKSSSQANPEIADKKGIRMLVSSECKKDEQFESSTLKKLSGNDSLSVRKLYENQFDYKPQFTMFFQCNGCPNLSDIDNGIKRRFRLIDHPVQFVQEPQENNFFQEKMDTTIKEKFSTDIRYRQQMMLILIDYYHKYIKDDKDASIKTPESIKTYTKNFINQNDVIAVFFDELGYTITNNNLDKIKPKILYDNYCDSNTRNEFEKLNRLTFYKLLEIKEGITKKKFSDSIYYCGIKSQNLSISDF